MPVKIIGDSSRLLRTVFILGACAAIGVGWPAEQDSRSTQRIHSIVFVSRDPLPSHIYTDKTPIPGFGPQYRTASAGGKLIIRESSGSTRTLVDSKRLFDVSDPAVSWDGKTIVFAGLAHPDSNWRIYAIGVDGSGFRRVTVSDRTTDLLQFGEAAAMFKRYDDIDPCFLPDGRVIFASTRYPSIAGQDQVLTTNLFVVALDGTGMRRVTTERNGAEEPTVDPVTGKVVYSRWWLNRDLPSNVTKTGLTREGKDALSDDIGNLWHAVTVRPDGHELQLYAGFVRTRQGTHTYKPSVMDDGRLLSTFSPYMSLTPHVGGAGVRWFRKGASFENHVIGTRSDEKNPKPPFALGAVQLAGNTILFSYSADGKDYGIYSCSLDGTGLRKVIDLPGTHELDVQVVRSRPVPPVIPEEYPAPMTDLPPTEDPQSFYVNDAFRFDCMNIFANGAVDEPMPDAPKITRGARIRFFMNAQRRNPYGQDPAILVKDAEVLWNGAVHEPDLPADVPLFEQVVDSKGHVLSSPGGNPAHVTGMNSERFGGGTKCAGCHAGHSMLPLPMNNYVAEWFNAATSAQVSASSYFISGSGKSYYPGRIIDRQVQTGGDTVNWVAAEGAGAWVELTWELPLEVKELVLYGVKENMRQGTTVRVHDSEIFVYYDTTLVERVASTGRLRQDGTRIAVPPAKANRIRIVVKALTGTVHQQAVAGMAEVEVIARIHQDITQLH